MELSAMKRSGAFKRYILLVGKNLWYNYRPSLFAAAALLLLLPVLFGLRELSRQESAAPLELGLSLLGIILITPVFMPETEPGIQETVSAKYTSYFWICVLRVACGALCAAAFTGLFLAVMRAGGCQIGRAAFVGVLANMMFLGGMGLLSHAAFNQPIAGYMVPSLYYAFNLAGARAQLGPFYLFSMMSGEQDGKSILLFTGLAAIAGALVLRRARLQRSGS